MSRTRLLPRPAFVRAVTARIAWLAKHRPEEQLDHFIDGLAQVRGVIESSPEVGSIVRQDRIHVLRMRLFPQPLPYVVYYAHRKGRPVREIYVVGLYGVGQDRPRFDMADWPW